MNGISLTVMIILAYCVWAYWQEAQDTQAEVERLDREVEVERRRAEGLLAERDQFCFELQQTRFQLAEAMGHMRRLEAVAGKEFGFLEPTGTGRDYPEMFPGPSTAIYQN